MNDLRTALERLVNVVEANAELVGDISIYGELNVAAEEARSALSDTREPDSLDVERLLRLLEASSVLRRFVVGNDDLYLAVAQDMLLSETPR